MLTLLQSCTAWSHIMSHFVQNRVLEDPSFAVVCVTSVEWNVSRREMWESLASSFWRNWWAFKCRVLERVGMSVMQSFHAAADGDDTKPEHPHNGGA